MKPETNAHLRKIADAYLARIDYAMISEIAARGLPENEIAGLRYDWFQGLCDDATLGGLCELIRDDCRERLEAIRGIAY